MTTTKTPLALRDTEVPLRTRPSAYPAPFARKVEGREKRPLGDVFGLNNFGVNLTRLPPGVMSALRHFHTKQDEFVYVLKGRPTLATDAGEVELEPGMCAGFKAGDPIGHHLVNRTNEDVVYLEVGDRTAADQGFYSEDDLRADVGPDGKWKFAHKDGRPY